MAARPGEGLQFPDSDSTKPAQVKFKLHGQHIHSIQCIEQYDIDAVKGIGRLVADIGRGIAAYAKGKPSVDIKYYFAAHVGRWLCRQRSQLQRRQCGARMVPCVKRKCDANVTQMCLVHRYAHVAHPAFAATSMSTELYASRQACSYA